MCVLPASERCGNYKSMFENWKRYNHNNLWLVLQKPLRTSRQDQAYAHYKLHGLRSSAMLSFFCDQTFVLLNKLKRGLNIFIYKTLVIEYRSTVRISVQSISGIERVVLEMFKVNKRTGILQLELVVLLLISTFWHGVTLIKELHVLMPSLCGMLGLEY